MEGQRSSEKLHSEKKINYGLGASDFDGSEQMRHNTLSIYSSENVKSKNNVEGDLGYTREDEILENEHETSQSFIEDNKAKEHTESVNFDYDIIIWRFLYRRSNKWFFFIIGLSINIPWSTTFLSSDLSQTLSLTFLLTKAVTSLIFFERTEWVNTQIRTTTMIVLLSVCLFSLGLL